jgi:hypothetical protein
MYLKQFVMTNTPDNTDQSPKERRYLDYMEKGDDFMKISIYRSAKEWYSRALELNFNNGLVQSKLENCNMLIQDEKKKIIVIVSIIAIGLIAVVLF